MLQTVGVGERSVALDGHLYVFCSQACRTRFLDTPQRYAGS